MTDPSTPAEPTALPIESTTTSTPPPQLADILRKKICDAPSPLKFGDVKKGLAKPRKLAKEAFEAEIRQILDEDVRAGSLFEHPATKPTDPPLYWSKPFRSPNDRPVVSEALLSAGTAPRKLADLIKTAVGATKAGRASSP